MTDFSHSTINRGPKLQETKVCTNMGKTKTIAHSVVAIGALPDLQKACGEGASSL